MDQIAREPSAFLTLRVLSQLPRALEACQSAITLRERVSQFFATIPGTASSAEMQSHQHFLSRLKTWYAQLKNVEDQVALEGEAGARGNVHKIAVGSQTTTECCLSKLITLTRTT